MWEPPARGRLVQTTWVLRPCAATLFANGVVERPDASGDANERTCLRRSCARRCARSRGCRCIRSVGWECREHPDGLAPDRCAVQLAGGRRGGERPVQGPEPGLGRQRPVPDVGHPPVEVRRHVGRWKRAGRHRDGEHGDDEVHGRRGVPGSVGRVLPEPEHMAVRSRRHRVATAGSSTASRTTRAREWSRIARTSSSR